VRFAPLPDSVVASILERRGLDPSVAPLAQGSASLALELADAEAKAARESFVEAALAALDSTELTAALKLAEGKKERDVLRADLSFLAQALAADARRSVEIDPRRTERRATEHAEVLAAIRDVERNVQPALAVESMVVRLIAR